MVPERSEGGIYIAVAKPPLNKGATNCRQCATVSFSHIPLVYMKVLFIDYDTVTQLIVADEDMKKLQIRLCCPYN